MTSRPSLKGKPLRPVSAIFLGTGSFPNTHTNPPGIPDLPEPPSPGASTSSNGSGLPSPPATNSTGSGSTGDTGSIGPVSLNNMLNGTNIKAFHAAFAANNTKNQRSHLDDVDDDDDNDNDNENDEDHTARVDRSHSIQSSSENVLALQRVKSLTQRNRMALDKLSSISRLSSPSPSHPNPRTSHSRSPAPLPLLPHSQTQTQSSSSHSQTASSSSTSSSSHASSRLSATQSHHRPARHTQIHPDHQSGSETERESVHHSTISHSSSSYHSSISDANSHATSSSSLQPQPSNSYHTSFRTPSPISPPPTNRIRRISAPASPGKALNSVPRLTPNLTGRTSPTSRPRTQRKRISIAPNDHTNGAPSSPEYEYSEGRVRDITQAALAAVANSRRSPTGTKKARQPLPKEFMDGGTGNSAARRGSLDHGGVGGSGTGRRGSGRFSAEPATPHQHNHGNQASPRQRRPSTAGGFDSHPGPGGGTGRVRELARRHQTRWLSDDMGSVASSSRATQDGDDGGVRIGRRQRVRGGSAESGLGAGSGRSLLGEGLRAAGLSPIRRRVGEDDVFGMGERSGEREKRIEWNTESMRSRSRLGGSRVDEPPRNVRTPDTRMHLDLVRTKAANGTGPGPGRSSTSLGYRREGGEGDRDEDEPRTAPPELRTYKSAYPNTLPQNEREMSLSKRETVAGDRAGSSLSRYQLQQNQHLQSQDRAYSSPFGSRRYSAITPLHTGTQSGSGSNQTHLEHTRLMMDSLMMFESHLGRIPTLNAGSSAELARSAQGIVYAAERLNGLLRIGTNKALEEQIDAEVRDGRGMGADLVEVWRKVGGEYREGLRVSDELVRGVTGFLLGVGRVVRDAGGGQVEGGHGRSVSLDEDGMGGGRLGRSSLSPDVGGSGRRSADSKRSWEQVRERERDEALRRLSGRPESVLGVRPPSMLNSRDLDRDTRQETPPFAARNATGNANATSSSSMRRLLTPREQRELNSGGRPLVAADSQETLHGYEPSPTPASRQQPSQNQNRTLGHAMPPAPDRNRTLPPLPIPQPLPTLPSESLRRSKTMTDKATINNASRDRDRRKISTTSISTTRANPTFPAITTPNATTALTPHTVSNSPERTTFPLQRADSGKSTQTNVTFSRPSAVSVSALSGLQQQHWDRKGAIPGTSSNMDVEPSTSVLGPAAAPVATLSGSETERDTKRRTGGARLMRMSLDGDGNGTLHADRNVGGASMLPSNSMRRERRRTVTDIWPNA